MGVTHGPQKGLFLMVDLTLMCPEVLLPLQGSGSIMLNPQNYQDICIYTLEYALQIDKPKSGLILNAFHTAGNHPKCIQMWFIKCCMGSPLIVGSVLHSPFLPSREESRPCVDVKRSHYYRRVEAVVTLW